MKQFTLEQLDDWFEALEVIEGFPSLRSNLKQYKDLKALQSAIKREIWERRGIYYDPVTFEIKQKG